jgi:hypothetical protein
MVPRTPRTPPTNSTRDTALVLGPLPVAFTQDASESPASQHALWYRYTALPDDLVIGVWFGTDSPTYKPWTVVWTPNVDGEDWDDFLGETEQDGCPLQLAVTSGRTYYFEVGSDVTPDTVIQVSLLRAPTRAAPIGSIAINDDAPGRPMAILSATTGEVLQFRHPFPAGEHGVVLPNGISLWDETDNDPVVHLYDATLTLIADLSWTRTASGPIGSNQVDRFYVSDKAYGGSTPWQLRTLSAAGIWGPVTWAISAHTTYGGPEAIGIARDETVVYYIFTKHLSYDGVVRRWDLVNNVPLSPLVPLQPGWTPGGRYAGEIVVLVDESVLVPYTDYSASPPVSEVRRYSRTGTLLQTYPLGGVAVNRVTSAYDGDLSFWVWSYPPHDQFDPPDQGYSRFERIRVSDGVVLQSVESVQYEQGSYGATDFTHPEAGDTVRFGHSFSCIYFSFPFALPGDRPPRTSACPAALPLDAEGGLARARSRPDALHQGSRPWPTPPPSPTSKRTWPPAGTRSSSGPPRRPGSRSTRLSASGTSSPAAGAPASPCPCRAAPPRSRSPG